MFLCFGIFLSLNSPPDASFLKHYHVVSRRDEQGSTEVRPRAERDGLPSPGPPGQHGEPGAEQKIPGPSEGCRESTRTTAGAGEEPAGYPGGTGQSYRHCPKSAQSVPREKLNKGSKTFLHFITSRICNVQTDLQAMKRTL